MIKTDNAKVSDFFENSPKNYVIEESREKLLSKVAHKITEVYKTNGSVNLNYICTHNSRRSQFGQVWAYYAAQYFGLDIFSFSGGTEVTAFHRNTVLALKNVGFVFNIHQFSHQNPVYQISFEGTKNSLLGFSKIFDHPSNNGPYIAITTCDSADENCPFIPEAIHRFHLPYKDPKYADNTPEQENAYLKTSEEVAAEVFYIFREVKSNL